MPTEPNLSTSGSMSPDILAVYMMDELLDRAEKDTVFWPLCEKSTVPKGSGKTVQFTRYERLPLPEAPLEESVTPAATPITLSTVDAVLDQWGAVVSMSDIVQLIIKHPLVQQARELLTLQHNELVDREVQVVAMGSTNVYFGGNKTSRASLVAGDVLSTDDIRRMVSRLRQNGAPTWSGGMYKGVVDPFVEMDLTKDPTFQQAGTNAPSNQIATLKDAYVGRWMGVDWMRSNGIPILSLLPAASYTIPAAGNTVIVAGGTGFAAGSAVKVVVTRLDPQTGFEVQASPETNVTNAAIFQVDVTIASGAPSGTYKIYSTMQGGAVGTATLQVRVKHVTGTANTVNLLAGGAPSTVGAYVVIGSGPVAPPAPPATINIHISYVMGRGFLGATTLDSLKTYVVPATASESDPLAQRTKTGWKQLFKALVLNPDFGTRVESASAFG
jgi:N4-gp56 family major capsid protein